MKINVQEIISYTEQTEIVGQNKILTLDASDNKSDSSQLYEYRKSYKKEVNDLNFPTGNEKNFRTKKINLNFNFFKTKDQAVNYLDTLPEYSGYKILSIKGPVPVDSTNEQSTKVWKFKIEYPIQPPLDLYNGFDLWYKDLFYGRIDNKNNTIKFKASENIMKQFEGTQFKLIDFVYDAAEGFFKNYNSDRKSHPKSILNNLKVTKAYVPNISYSNYLKNLNQQFFNDVLDSIKNTKKVSNFNDYLNLFYNWAEQRSIPVTEAAFYKSVNYNIYSTGLAFDVFNITSEEQKQAILNDPRYRTLYYVAKINGLRVDPNYPTRLIADIKSPKLLDIYAKNYFEEKDIQKLPPLIYNNYYDLVEFNFSSKNTIILFLLNFINFYNKFSDKYSFLNDFNASGDISQNYKKKFTTNKILRKQALGSDLLVEREDGNFTLNKNYVETYVNFRLYEEGINLSKKEYNFLITTMMAVISINDAKAFETTTNFSEKLLTSVQAINYLENFINSKKNPGTDKVNFAFLFGLAKEFLTSGEDFSNLVQQDEEGNIFSESPVDISTDFS